MGFLPSAFYWILGARKQWCTKDLLVRMITTGSVVQIRRAHGDVCQYPVAKVIVRVAGQEFKLEAVVSGMLPKNVLLGNDVR